MRLETRRLAWLGLAATGTVNMTEIPNPNNKKQPSSCLTLGNMLRALAALLLVSLVAEFFLDKTLSSSWNRNGDMESTSMNTPDGASHIPICDLLGDKSASVRRF